VVALTVHLVRHGETDWNLQTRIQGSTDIPLNDTGREQAREAAAALAELPVGAIIASDLSRARETAEIIAAPHHLGVLLDPRLRERGFGVLEGRLNAEAAETFGPEWRARLDFSEGGVPRAESTAMHYARVADFFDSLRANPPAEEMIVVSHGGTVRRALSYARGGYGPERWEPVPNASVHTITLA
jgi:uncharacterized phosphatase